MSRTPSLGHHALWRGRVSRQCRQRTDGREFCAVKVRLVGVSVVETSVEAYRSRVPPLHFTHSATSLPVTVRVAESVLGDPAPDRRHLPMAFNSHLSPTANARLACQLVLAVAGAKTNSGGLEMISLSHGSSSIPCHTPATDLRKGFDALSGLVSTAFSQDPTTGHLFLFVNRRRDRLKILYWDRDGLGNLVQAARDRLVPGTCTSPRCRLNRDEAYPIVADPLRHRHTLGPATKTSARTTDTRSRKSTGPLL